MTQTRRRPAARGRLSTREKPRRVSASALLAVIEVLGSLRDHGSLQQVSDRLASFDERQQAVAKDKFDALEARYR